MSLAGFFWQGRLVIAVELTVMCRSADARDPRYVSQEDMYNELGRQVVVEAIISGRLAPGPFLDNPSKLRTVP